jgi:hypothetical protein
MTSVSVPRWRPKGILLVCAVVSFLAVTASAQTSLWMPPADSPGVLLGYRRFHVAGDNAIKTQPRPAADQLNLAAQRTFGLAPTEFAIVTAQCRSALAGC